MARLILIKIANLKFPDGARSYDLRLVDSIKQFGILVEKEMEDKYLIIDGVQRVRAALDEVPALER